MDNCKHNAGTYADQFGTMRCPICNRVMSDRDLDDFRDYIGEV